MRPLTVLIDLDSIIVDLWAEWCPRYNRRTGDTLTMEKITDWGVSAAKHRGALFGVLKDPGFFASLRPFPGALEGVKAISDLGHRVVIVTAGRKYALHDKAEWVEKHLPWLDGETSLVLAWAKELVRGDVLFDDGPHNVEAYRKAWPGASIATIAYPYNRDALHHCDLVAGSYANPAAAWARFVAWVADGAPPACEPILATNGAASTANEPATPPTSLPETATNA
jgi:5'-nucleotidase